MGAKIIKGRIINIQRYSVHDGPGIRSTVFMKGCPLRCVWCSNPESQLKCDEVLHRNSLCERCGRCVEACESRSISLSEDGVKINRETCIRCGKCVESCYAGALSCVGRLMSVEEVLVELEKDSLFYRNSNGGITIGGGEPLLQADFVRTLLEACHRKGWHTTLDTCGYASVPTLERVLRHADLVLYDLKHMNPGKHKEMTGVPTHVILRNAKVVSRMEIPMIIRIPVIPGMNDDEENLRQTAKFLTTLKNVTKIQLLPYHRGGVGKYFNLDRNYPLGEIAALRDEDLTPAKETLESYGLKAEIGG